MQFGIYAYNRGGITDTNIISNKKLAESNEKQTKSQNTNNVVNEVISTALVNTNISPNAIIIEKRYYKDCDHLIRKVIDIPEELVNKTEEDVKKSYSGWKLEGYSTKEIVFSKEFKGFCDEHYIVKENNGFISIYNVDKNGVQKLKENTEISTMYLPEKDIEDLKIGISIVGKMNLYSFLEDYE